MDQLEPPDKKKAEIDDQKLTLVSNLAISVKALTTGL